MVFCCLSIAAYQLAFIIGVNTPANTNLAYWIWYSNVIEDILIGAFAFHFFTLAADGAEKFKRLIQSMYVFGFPYWYSSYNFSKRICSKRKSKIIFTFLY